MLQRSCDEVQHWIIKGCDNFIQADEVHDHVLNCIKCAKFKAKQYDLTIEQVIEALVKEDARE